VPVQQKPYTVSAEYGLQLDIQSFLAPREYSRLQHYHSERIRLILLPNLRMLLTNPLLIPQKYRISMRSHLAGGTLTDPPAYYIS
jgi:hypothetical protein